MPQAINIYTTTGQRIDVMPNTTIEINMGGISLLNLQDRTATYSNSFTLPRTPNNEQIFAFASQPTRNNRPEIEVIIQKGLFSKNARLKVLSFEGDYKVSISYDKISIIDILKTKTVKDILRTVNFGTFANDGAFITAMVNGISGYRYLSESRRMIPSDFINEGQIFYSINAILLRITEIYNITFSGYPIGDSIYNLSYYPMKGSYTTKNLVNGNYSVVADSDDTVFLIDIIKEIAYIFCCDVKIEDNEIKFTRLSSIMQSAPINIEGFKYSKELYSNLANINKITYTLSKDILNQDFASDNFTSSGVGVGTVLQLKTYIPKSISTGYVFTGDSDSRKAPTVLYAKYIDRPINVTWKNTTVTVPNHREVSFIQLSEYSNILAPIFANPVILDASGYIDPLKANQIMTTRIINSVQLGGRYWVDSMAYDLVSGNSKLKLIKL